MIKTDKAVIVEGKYDKIKLESVLDAVIIPTDGFSVFNDKEKLRLIRNLAKTRGIIILTDSDSAGFKIRSYLKGAIPSEQITNVYIPDIKGKEKRKDTPSTEGKLGVEGMDVKVLNEAFRKAGVVSENVPKPSKKIDHKDFYEDGLSGSSDSSMKRNQLKKQLDLPSKLSTSSLIDMLNIFLTYEEYKEMVNNL